MTLVFFQDPPNDPRDVFTEIVPELRKTLSWLITVRLLTLRTLAISSSVDWRRTGETLRRTSKRSRVC